MIGGLISRELAESSADIYSFERARHLGISRNACESEIKIAQVFKANPFRKYSANYPSQATRFSRCIAELSIKIS